MPDESTLCLDRVLVARPNDRATGVEDANRAAAERLLDDLFNRPTQSDDRLAVIRDAQTRTGAQPRAKTKEEQADELKKRADRLMSRAHESLSFTAGQFEPRTLDFRPRVAVSADTSPLDLARAELKDANQAQLEAYAAIVMNLNGITGNINEASIKAGRELTLPGQRADGGLFWRRNGVSTTEWHDGSRTEQAERGDGFASFKEKDGTNVRIEWNPESADGNLETRIKDDNKVESYANGDKVEYVRDGGGWKTRRQTTSDDRGRKLELEFDPVAGGPPNLIRITDAKDKTVMELRFVSPGNYRGEKKNDKGEVVDADVRLKAGRDSISIWSEKTNADNTVTRTYESGTSELFNERGQLLKREGKDAWQRQVVEEYTAGEQLPHTITVTGRDGKEIKFDRKPFGDYQADYKNERGQKIGVIELKSNGLILYSNDRSQTAHAELPDGSTIDRRHFANGRQEIKQSKDGNVLTKLLDREGTIIEAKYESTDGRKITRRTAADGQSIESISLEDVDAADKQTYRTELRYDRDSGLFTGTRRNASGEAVERVHYMQGKLVFTDVNNIAAPRFESLNVFARDLFGVKLNTGKYEAATGTISYKNADGSTTVESFAPGRSDVTSRAGVTVGTTVTGQRSEIRNDVATVHNADRTGVRLNANRTIDRWGPAPQDNGLAEPLTKVEAGFLRAHPEIDRRALAEIHRQFHGKPEVIDRFYAALSEIDTLKDMTAAEKADLRRGLMHHVANPQDLYQGNSWCCNVAVVQREMAMNMPDKYVKTVVDALGKGEVTLADGGKVPVRNSGLRIADTTGRDMPTRVFHSVALQVKYHPRFTFRNTEDGAGRLIPNNPGDAPQAFVGMDMDEIVETRHKLTGEKKAVVHVSTVADLVRAYEANGSRSMVVAVNADRPPFADNGLGALFADQQESRPNHVVTITRVDAGPPVKFYVQNQWGLQEDLSSPATAVDGQTLLGSMLGRRRARAGTGMAVTPAQVISAGEPGRQYFYRDGVLTEQRRR